VRRPHKITRLGQVRTTITLVTGSARTAELQAQLAAMARILKMIGRPAMDERRVLKTLLEEVARLVDAQAVAMFRRDGDDYHLIAAHGMPPAQRELATHFHWRPSRASVVGRLALEGKLVHIPDVLADADYDIGPMQHAGGFRTLLGVPLQRAGQMYGSFTAQRAEVAPFTRHQIELVERFAAQAMVVVENARLAAELRERTAAQDRAVRELEALRGVTAAVSSTLDVDTVLTAVLREAVGVLGDAAGSISAFEPGSDSATMRITVGLEPELVEGFLSLPVRLGTGLAGQAAAQRRSLQKADLSLAEPGLPVHPAHELLVARGFHSMLAVPLHTQDRILGVMAIMGRQRGGFPTETVTLLEGFADQSALALRNAELYSAVEERRRRLAELARGRERLFELSTALQQPLTLHEQLGRVFDAARPVVGVDRAAVWELTPDRSSVVCLAASGTCSDDFAGSVGVPVPVEDHWACEVLRDGLARVYDEDHPLPARGMQCRGPSLLVVPMIARGRVVGAVGADNEPTRCPLLPETAELMQYFASHAAIAIDNARLFAEISAHHRELEVARRQKAQFLARMSHELRTPLNAVIGYGEMLAEQAEEQNRPDFVPDLAKITGAGRHLLELIDAVLDLSKIEAGAMDLCLETIDVATLLAEVQAVIAPLAAAGHNVLTVRCPRDVGAMRADRTKLRQILLNVLGNACKFTNRGCVRLEAARTAQCGDRVRFTVTDTGIGMTAEQLGRLFTEFSQADADTARRFGGTGLGLALSRRMCRLMGGDITASSHPDEGSSFTIDLPGDVDAALALRARCAAEVGAPGG
jgi:signal transduction histidine kinase